MITKFRYCLIFLIFTIAGCRKVSDDPKTSITGLSEINIKYGGLLTISGHNFNTSAGAYEIFITDSVNKYTIPPLSVSESQIQIEIYNHEDPKSVLNLTSFYVGIKTATGTIMTDKKVNIVSSWIKVKDFPGTARYKTSAFSLGGNCYLGGGAGNGAALKDFWKYTPDSDTWTRMADIPGSLRVYPRSFANATNGFMGSGYSTDNSSRVQLYDFYKYNPADNTWNAIDNYPDNILSFYVGYTVTVNGRPFISLSNQVLAMRELANGIWVSTASIPDMIDCPAAGVFSIGKMFYVILGNRINNTVSNAVWEYNSDTGVWSEKAHFPGPARYAPSFFSVGNYGYYGCGMSTSSQQFADMWRYDPAEDKWIRMQDFPGGIRSHLVSTSDGKSGFAGLGIVMSYVTYCSDFWRYDP